eukprot:CAMPEP_0119039262 /NCGR_PEP_ID=MMETSP1177-20130426/8657_1 /TAXON_ID=2985 /ORGANISM="Ochromonas sp, Strain CCMP1899" /LENGTH=643 /DNA_ID=CAMNT_0007002923 /DNA_START=641 /DNA_END=2572 /DNA_ORIENTATION=+
MAKSIIKRLLLGFGMTRRERLQLVRTTTDVFRLVPFAIFVLVPFMEFLLPVALRLFPNMLPSTFQDNLKKEDNMKKELQMRLAVAGFMQETLTEMASKKNIKGKDEDSSAAAEVVDFIAKARLGQPLPKDSVVRIARLFKDELTLSNISRPQLVSMCEYMGLPQYGADAFLRFQLRTKLRNIKEDDRRILWEGIDVLTSQELREACQERGMNSIGLTQFGYKRQLQEWLDLSIQKSIPISLLIMSRAFLLTSNFSNSEDLLRSSISSFDSDIINEVVLASANTKERNSSEMQLRKLESLKFQNDLIEEEREETTEAKNETEESKKEIKLDKKEEKLLIESIDELKTIHLQDDRLSAERGEQVASEGERSSSKKDAKIDFKEENEKGKSSRPLSTVELEAISDLARGSAVGREKQELATLKAAIEKEERDKVSKDGSSGGAGRENYKLKPKVKVPLDPSLMNATDYMLEKPEEKDGAAEVDESVSRMTSALNSMLETLQVKIDSTEKALGDSLNLLDQDKDGELTVTELKSAIKKILKRTINEDEAQQIVQLIDKDNDGKVSVRELFQYVETKKEKAEVEALEAQIHNKRKKNFIEEILSTNVSEGHADELVQMIQNDAGKDISITDLSVRELKEYAKKIQEKR